MGSQPSTPPPPPPPPKDRVFIMIGRVAAGKSTLGNLLSGEQSFQSDNEARSYSNTQKIQTIDIELSAETVLGVKMCVNNPITIKVIDQPGMDDTNFNLQDHGSNLIKCMEEINVKTFPTFLIVINPTLDRLLDDGCTLLTQLSELLMQSSYNLFSHAVVVFTHADEMGCDVNNMEEMIGKIELKFPQIGWRGLVDILDAVDNRIIFVNGTNTEPLHRCNLLRRLFDLSKSTLHIRCHGNNGFSSEILKRKLGIHTDGIMEEEFYNLDYQFHPDRDLFRMNEENDLKQEIERAVQSMIALGEGISSMVLLISLVDPFSKAMEELVYGLPQCYVQEDDPKFDEKVQKWWRHVFIVFKVSDEDTGKSSVDINMLRNYAIKKLVEKVKNKWTWIAKNTTERVCRDRITEMCLDVRKAIGGKVFIENSVIKELKNMMADTKKSEAENTQVAEYDAEFHKKLAKGAIYFIESQNSKIMKLGGIPLRYKISVRSLRFLLLNTLLSEKEMKRFRETYQDPRAKVSIEEVLKFLAEGPLEA